MTNKQTTRHLFTVLLMLLLGTFCPAALVRAQKPAKPQAAAPSGQQEGIRVHGQWTIEVRNPDGKLVMRREFKNALHNDGAESLGRFLRRTHTPGLWTVSLGSSGQQPCLSNTNTPVACVINETSSLDGRPDRFNTLVISAVIVPPGFKTVLAGTATAQRDGIIDAVSTRLAHCRVDNPDICIDDAFAGTSISAINVVAGQIIQVKVVISFS